MLSLQMSHFLPQFSSVKIHSSFSWQHLFSCTCSRFIQLITGFQFVLFKEGCKIKEIQDCHWIVTISSHFLHCFLVPYWSKNSTKTAFKIEFGYICRIRTFNSLHNSKMHKSSTRWSYFHNTWIRTGTHTFRQNSQALVMPRLKKEWESQTSVAGLPNGIIPYQLSVWA